MTNLRTQLLLISGLFLLLQIGILYALVQWDLSPTLHRLEYSVIEKKLNKNIETIQRELLHLEETNKLLSLLPLVQYSAQSQRMQNIMFEQEINLFYLLDNNNHVLFGTIIDLDTFAPYPHEKFLPSLWKERPTFLKALSPQQSQTGLYNSPLGPMLLASTPITTMDHPNQINGIVIIGKWLPPTLLSDTLLWPLEGAALSEKHQAILHEISQTDSNFLLEHNANTMQAYVSLPNLNQKNDLLLSASHPLEFSKAIKTDMLFFAASLISLQILFMLIISWLIRRRLMLPTKALLDQFQNQHNTFQGINLSRQSWGELNSIVKSIGKLMMQYQEILTKQNRLAYQQGIYFTNSALSPPLESMLKECADNIHAIEKKLTSLPTSEVGYLLAESRTLDKERLDNFLANLIMHLEKIDFSLKDYQKTTQSQIVALHNQVLRHTILLRRQLQRVTPIFDFPSTTRSSSQ